MPFFKGRLHLNGSINKQNVVIRQHTTKQNCIETLFTELKWSGGVELKSGIVGPYFFEEDGAVVTVNFERYVTKLCNVLWPHLKAFGINICSIVSKRWRHYASMAVVWEMFLQRASVISTGLYTHQICSFVTFLLWGQFKW